MESVPLREALEKAKKIDSLLTACDFTWGNRVFIQHEDGSIIDLNYAFAQKDGPWWFVFSEHNGYHVFHEGDIEEIQEYKVHK